MKKPLGSFNVKSPCKTAKEIGKKLLKVLGRERNGVAWQGSGILAFTRSRAVLPPFGGFADGFPPLAQWEERAYWVKMGHKLFLFFPQMIFFAR